MIELKQEDFFQKTEAGKWLIEFWAPWCHVCRAYEPVLNELAVVYKDKIAFASLNTEEFPELAETFGVMSLPTLLYIEAGKPLGKMIGAVPKGQLSDYLQQKIN